MNDLNFGFRQLWKNLGFAFVTVVLWSPARATENGGEVWWPQFRGPNSSGLGRGKPPVHFGPGQNVLWKAAVGSGLSSPIVWGGRIFLTEFVPTSQKLATVCIDRRTGNILWRRAVETSLEIEFRLVMPFRWSRHDH